MHKMLPLLALTVSTPALAGGIGIIGTGGFHQENVYFYDSGDNDRQYRQPQTIGSGGTGIEVVLGDRDDRMVGIFRGFWILDTPQQDPAERTQLVDPANVTANYRDNARHVGMGSVGLSYGFVGNPDRFLVNAVVMVGSGFLTNDHTEFFFAEGGAGASYRFARQLQAHVTASYQVRHRKGFQHGAVFYGGVRYLFD